MDRTRPGTAAVRALLVLALSWGLAVPWAPVALAQRADRQAAHAELQRQRRMVQAVRDGIDTGWVDADALALDTAFMGDDEIVEFVATKFRYEVYRGVLRGPQGTVVARAGNAWDLSVLLARLLGDAGYETRIARGTLSDDDALRLVSRVFEPGSEDSAFPEPADAVAAIAAAAGLDEAQLLANAAMFDGSTLLGDEHFQEAVEAGDVIVGALAAAGIDIATDVHATLLEEARAYAWVEYRLGANDVWSAAHPAFGELPRPTVAATGEYLTASVPEELQHRLRLEMAIERKRGDRFFVEPLMTPWERPVANLLGVNLSVGNSVVGADSGMSIGELGTSLADVAFFVPMLNGQIAPGARAFDTMGNVVAPDVAASAMAGVFQTASERAGGAAAAVGALGEDGPADDEPFALTAQWIDIVLVSPGGDETRYRRYVFDRRVPEARATSDGTLLGPEVVWNGILTSIGFMVSSGHLSDAYLAYDGTEQALRYLDGMQALLDSDDTLSSEERIQVALNGNASREQLALMVAFQAVDSVLGGTAYRAEPTVVAIRQSLTPGDRPTAALSVDIVHNERRYLTSVDGGVRNDPERAVLAGAWDTLVERTFMQRYGGTVYSAYEAFAATVADPVVVAPHDDDALASLPVPAEARTAMREDIDAGFALVVPGGEANEGATWAWWRVDPSTGTTLGVGVDGQGVASVEYEELSVSVSVALAAVLAVPAAMMCATKSGDDLILCLCDIVTGAAIFLPIGVFIGAAFGAAAGIASFLYLDVGFGVVSLVTPIGGPCNWVDRVMSDAEQRCVLA